MLTPEKFRATQAIINRLQKLAKKCDEVGVQLGNGGQLGSILGSCADDLESKLTNDQMEWEKIRRDSRIARSEHWKRVSKTLFVAEGKTE